MPGAKKTKRLAKLIKDRREELDMSREELRKKVKVLSPNFVGMVETGAAKFPDTDVWLRWADALDIPRNVFLQTLIKDLHSEYLPYLSFKDATTSSEEFKRSDKKTPQVVES